MRVTALADRSRGGLWIGTEREGVWVLHGGEFVEELIPGVGEQPTTTGVVEDGEGALWLATNQGAFRRSAEGSWEQLTDRVVFDLDLGAEGEVWLCGGALQRVRGGQIEHVPLPHDQHCLGGVVTPDGGYLARFDDRLELVGPDARSRGSVTPTGLEPGWMSGPALAPSGHVWVGSGERIMDLGPWDRLLAGGVEPRSDAWRGPLAPSTWRRRARSGWA